MMLKTLVAVAVAVLAAILPGIAEGPMTFSQIVNVVVLGAGAIHVFNASNTTAWRYAKLIAAAVAAGGVVLVSALSDGGVSTAEWIQIALAVAGAGGVYGVKGPMWRVADAVTGGGSSPKVA